MGQPEKKSADSSSGKVAKFGGESSRKTTAMWIGFAVTLIVAIIFLFDTGERLELMCLSFRQKIASRAIPPGNVICVDIDDASIARIGRWPWPREILAGSVDVLKKCGAKIIAFDVIFPDPQELRYDAPSGWLYETQDSHGVFSTPPTPVFDDLIFARGIKSAGNVFLPIHLDFISSISKRELELQKSVNDFFNSSKNAPTFSEVKKAFSSADDELLKRVWLRKLSLQYCRDFELNYLYTDLGKLNCSVESGYVQPPLVSLAESMGGTGFVTFKGDIDGVVRRMSLLAEDGEKIFPQFALSIAACDIGNCPIKNISFECKDRELEFTAPNGLGRSMPLDPQGRMLIRYSADTWREGGGPNHIPVSCVVLVWQEMEHRKDLDKQQMAFQLKFMSLGFGEDIGMAGEFQVVAGLAQKRDLLFERKIAAQRAVYRNELFGGQPQVKLNEQFEVAAAEFEDVKKQLTLQTAEVVKKISSDEEMLKTYAADNISEAREILATLKSLPEQKKISDANIEKLTAELKTRVEEKICLIGSTSTGAADFVPTPLGQRTPGMVVHANLINTIVQDSFLRQAPWWLSFALMLFCGVLTSLAAARQEILTALFVAFTFAVAYAVFNIYTVFVQMGVWLELVGVLATILAAFMAVTIYRELTEEHAKRKIKAMFSHALSPELVEQLMADPSTAQLGGHNRHITCLFSDLGGFTALSGRLGPHDTVKLLNRYFDCVTDIVQKDWGGYINKFLGDGVFAIFGAPVHQDDHPSRSLQAAVAYTKAVADLNSALQEEGFENAALKVRIGLTTDNAMVGNCGSSRRMDYTAIGSVVNLSSRLESANKFFGTLILAEQYVIESGTDAGIVARYMGRVMINGVTDPVETWNIIGLRDELPAGLVEAADTFTQAVRAMQRRDFSGAIELFNRAGEIFGPDDKPAKIFLKICQNAVNSPNPAEYQPEEVNTNGVVKLII